MRLASLLVPALLVCALAQPSWAQARLQSGTVTVGATAVTVGLDRTFTSPVVVCTVRYANNTIPVVARVSNVQGTSFDVRLENPSGSGVAAETVDYLVVEEGAWTIDDLTIEAQAYVSTETDHDSDWQAESQTYDQAYTDPVVLGQVMTENDADWSVFWCRGSSRENPPSSSSLWTGKTVCEDSDTTRADETVGFVVAETASGTVNGVDFESALGADTVTGIDNSPPFTYTFNAAFTSTPQVGLATMAGLDGVNGGWACLYGASPITTTTLDLVVDEDQLGDSERSHTSEQLGYLVFEQPVLFPNSAPTDPAGLTLTECAQGGGTDKTPALAFTTADGDGDDVSYRIQVDDTDNSFASLVIDYTSGPAAVGATSFTVGQSVAAGSYTLGSAGQELPVGTYYWRVQTTDGYKTSSWVQGASFSVVEPTLDFSSGTYNGGEAGGAITVTVNASSDSCETITVNYASSDGTATQSSDYASASGTLTFTPGDTNKTFTVTPLDDDLDEVGETLTLTLSGPADATLAGVNNPATLTINDNDTAGVTLTESAGSTDVVEGGATDTYTLALDTKPTADVTLTITPDADSDLGGGAGVAVQRTFTSGNWSIGQVVTVSALNDDIAEGGHTSTITHAAASTDGNYNGIAIGNTTANITDNDTAAVTVTQTGISTVVTEGGVTDTYSVVLTSEPIANVTVTVDPDVQSDVGAGAGATIPLTFTNADWSTPQVVTVTAVDDDVDEDTHTSLITHSAASGDGNYNGIAIATITGDITDNDTAGMTLVESGGSTDVVEGGATDSYTLVLESEPVANVTVTVTPDAELNLGAGAGVSVALVFSNANWDTPQTVTATPVDDDIDKDAHTATITHAVSSTDGKYGGMSVGNVTVNVTDDDTAGVTITQSGGTTSATEGGATDTYTVVLDSRPTANVTVTVDPDAQTDLGGGPGTPVQLIFAPAGWAVAQTVTVTAADDSVTEGGHVSTITHVAASVDLKYNGFDLSGDNVTAAITDNDAGGVTLTESGVGTSLIETGSTDTYTLVLDSEPTANVVLTLDPDDQTNLGAGRDVAIQLTFTPANWFTPQVVTVTAFNDAIHEGGHTSTITHAASSTDSVYNGLAIPDLVANIADDDVAGVTLAESGGSTAATEGGATDTYTIVLDSHPTANVTATVTPDGQTDLGSGAGVAIQFVFTGGDWAVARTVTVTANNDAVDEDAHNSTITHSLASADGDYNGMAVSDVVATITDNDTAGVTITESAGSTDIAEGGATDTYTVVLDSQPTATVTVTLDPDGQADLGSGIGAPVQFTFNAGNWSVAQTATVTAVNDGLDEGAHSATMVHSVSSTDPKYNGMNLSGSDVVAAITDNDTAGVTIVESGGSSNGSEAGGVDTYTLVLDSEPAANVTITVTPDADSDLGAGAGVAVQRIFTPGNWSVAQLVTIAAVNDDIAEGPHTSTMTHAAASTDGKYNGLAIGNVTANLTDNDSASVNIWPTSGAANVTEDGTTDSYTLVLNSEPTADVTITVDPDAQADVGAGAGAARQLTFTAANWATQQTVTVAAIDDDVDEGDHTSTIVQSATSGDGNYDGIAITNITADIADNDTAGISAVQSAGSTDVIEDGATDSYTIVLGSEPVANVTITVTPDAALDLGSGGGVAVPLVFDNTNWDTPQTVTAAAVDDDAETGNRTATVTHAVTSADGKYNGAVMGNVVIAITEDDSAGVSSVESDGQTSVGEGAATDAYTIVLDSQPGTDVLIVLDPGSEVTLGAGAGVPIQLTFTAANWATPQVVTVTAVDDTTIEGTHSTTITHSIISGDAAYSAATLADVLVTIADNDSAGTGGGSGPGGGGGAGETPGGEEVEDEEEEEPEDDPDDEPDEDEAEDGEGEDGQGDEDQGEEPEPDSGDSGGSDAEEPGIHPPDDDGDDWQPPEDTEPEWPDDPDSEPLPEIVVRIEASAPTARVGDEVWLTIFVSNVGQADAWELDLVLQLSPNGEVLEAELIDGDDARTLGVSVANTGDEVLVSVGELPAGQSVEVELLVQAGGTGMLTLAAEVGSGELVFSEELTEVEVEETYEMRVTTRRPVAPCGVAALPVVLIVGLVLALQAVKGRRVIHRRGLGGWRW